MSPALIFLCGSVFGAAVAIVGMAALDRYQRRLFMRTGGGAIL